MCASIDDASGIVALVVSVFALDACGAKGNGVDRSGPKTTRRSSGGGACWWSGQIEVFHPDEKESRAREAEQIFGAAAGGKGGVASSRAPAGHVHTGIAPGAWTGGLPSREGRDGSRWCGCRCRVELVVVCLVIGHRWSAGRGSRCPDPDQPLGKGHSSPVQSSSVESCWLAPCGADC